MSIMAEVTLIDLAERGAVSAFEDRWLTAIEENNTPREEMLAALDILNRDGHGANAAELAWTWLTNENERATPAEVLELGRACMLRCADNPDMRAEMVRLYEQVYAERPGIGRLMELAGLKGNKSPRRALRTLEIALNVKEGDALLSRSEEQAARVIGVDHENCLYTLKAGGVEQTLDADELALKYDPVDANDFRVLRQLAPEQIPELMTKDPAGAVIGILKSHRGRIDADELKHLLIPAVLPAEQWAGWWSKARNALKRCPHVVLEGRNPVSLVYDAQGRSLEDEILPAWIKAETPAQRLTVLDNYLREARGRKTQLQESLLGRMRRDLSARIETARRYSPGDALAEALVLERLDESTSKAADAVSVARAILSEASDPADLLVRIKDSPRFVRSLELLQETRPEAWPELFERVIPRATGEGCEWMAQALLKGGHSARLAAAMNRIPEDFLRHLDAVCWLWRGPADPAIMALDGLILPPPRQLLPRLLEHLGQLVRQESTPPDVLRDARVKIRNALSANKYARYREVITDMGDSLAFTVYWTIDRLEGLGQVVREDTLNVIRAAYPRLFAQKRTDPWFDESIIFCTNEGMNKRREELDHLLKVKIPQNAKAIGEAASHGDLSENSEYKFALEERDLLQARVLRIQDELGRARMLAAQEINTSAVDVGTRVTVVAVNGGAPRDLIILGPWESDMDKGIYNYRAPLCLKLKGLKVGDVVTLDLDSGEQSYRVENITNALARPAS
ncbi:MAG: hypothetical protein GXY44_05120 [Phycisphaerales bacterium]|nr:hypothetical protein [Phycisphaerales bacterium]